MEVIWKGNPISCSKSFGKLNCTLCMKERLAILKTLGDKDNKRRLINSNTELHGACRHKPKFHRFTHYTSSTDDGQKSPERGRTSSIISSQDIARERPNMDLNFCMAVNTVNSVNDRYEEINSQLASSTTTVETI